MGSFSDPISDMLTRIRNSQQVGQMRVDIPSSKLKIAIARILKNEGFVKNYKIINDSKQKILRIYLKNYNKQSAIISLKRISKPSRRKYIKSKDLGPVYNNVGIWILSTSKGIITNREAKKINVGGEILCEVC